MSAKEIKFVINQVSTCLYRTNKEGKCAHSGGPSLCDPNPNASPSERCPLKNAEPVKRNNFVFKKDVIKLYNYISYMYLRTDNERLKMVGRLAAYEQIMDKMERTFPNIINDISKVGVENNGIQGQEV